MKLRITLAAVTAIALGGLFLSAMTKADIIELHSGRLIVGGEETDCWLKGLPSDSSEIRIAQGPLGLNVKQPGHLRFQNLVLQFEAGQLPPWLAQWHQSIMAGRADARDAALIILGKEEEEKSTFNFFECWPSALRGMKQTRVGFRGAVVEEVEIVVGGYEMVTADVPIPVGE